MRVDKSHPGLAPWTSMHVDVDRAELTLGLVACVVRHPIGNVGAVGNPHYHYYKHLRRKLVGTIEKLILIPSTLEF